MAHPERLECPQARAPARAIIAPVFVFSIFCTEGAPCVDIVLLIKAAIMGIVEGLTEFLPISSTGHLILTGALLGFDDAKSKVFDIAIQTGAIFAVILVYWQRLREVATGLGSDARARRFTLNVAIAFCRP